MAESHQVGDDPDDPTGVYLRLDSATRALLEAIGGKEFYVKVQWPHGDLISNAYQLRADKQEIQIHLGRKSPEGYAGSELHFCLPIPDTEHDELPEDCIHCEFHPSDKGACLMVACLYQGGFPTTQRIYIVTSLELLFLLIAEAHEA